MSRPSFDGAAAARYATLVYLPTLPPVTASTLERVAWAVLAVAGTRITPPMRGRFWAIVTMLVLVRIGWAWSVLENHAWLLAGWTVVLALSASEPREWLAEASRRLLGTVFILAVVQKLLSPEFRSGLFFEVYLLESEWLRPVIDGLGVGTGSDWSRLVAQVATGQQSLVTLERPASLVWVAAGLTVWTLVIEALVGACWLVPVTEATGKRARLRQGRLTVLTVFIATTYLAIPVYGFAALLMAIALPHATRPVAWGWLGLLGLIGIRALIGP